jgi:glycosyltransferase involved in cell wall biosynthesis
MRQAGQIAAHMTARGHRHPVFWFYNPHLAFPYVLLPARARIFHATENYFDFPNLVDDWLNWYAYAIEVSDLVIACSAGVADGLQKHTKQKPLNLPNGCDFRKYSAPAPARGDWPARLAGWQQAQLRLAVFAGNINNRLDFTLIESLARQYPNVGFVFVGPVDFSNLTAAQGSAWERLQRASNIIALGRIPAEDLPALYWCCDVGFIPYRTDLPVIVENGFPLKALEMAAAGLPVVASLMKPLREVSDAVTVTSDAEAFCAAIATHSRRHRDEAERKAAEQICRGYDYDFLFERMAQSLSQRIGDGRSQPAEFKRLCERIGIESYTEAVVRLKDAPKMWQRARFWLGVLLSIIPAKTRHILPEPIRRFGRRFIS